MAADSPTVDPALYRLAIEQTREYALFLLDTDGRILTWNAGAEAIKGYAAEEVIGRHFSIFYPPEAQQIGWPAHELKMATQEGRFEDEGWRTRKDGSRFWANVVITALRDDNGKLVAFSKITRDLTDRKLHEEALRQSEERFRLLVDGVVDYAIYMLDPTGVVTSWNAGARRIKGYTRDEIIGRHFSRFYVPEDIDVGKPWEDLATARRSGRSEQEGWRHRKDGQRFWARTVLTRLVGFRGTLARVCQGHPGPQRASSSARSGKGGAKRHRVHRHAGARAEKSTCSHPLCGAAAGEGCRSSTENHGRDDRPTECSAQPHRG